MTERCMKLAFQGSRSLDGDDRAYAIIKAEIQKHQPDIVITAGEPTGICRMAQEVCRNEGITLKLYHLQRKKHAGGIFHHRSLAILNDADHCILIHDGVSIGTRNELALAKRLKKPHTYHLLERLEEPQFDLSGLELDLLNLGQIGLNEE